MKKSENFVWMHKLANCARLSKCFISTSATTQAIYSNSFYKVNMDLVNHSKLKSGWGEFFDQELEKAYFKNLLEKVKRRYDRSICYPPKDLVFNAFYTTDLNDIKVVILGQDPYHGPNQANGLAFAVNRGIKVPPSLNNIFKEVQKSLCVIPNKTDGDLTRWSRQGVFLLNAVLTVEKGKPRSHQDLNWQCFTDKVITFISESTTNVVFVLWGEFAKRKSFLIKGGSKHLILTSGHPSPFSEKYFFGNNHFELINKYLENNGKENIDFR